MVISYPNVMRSLLPFVTFFFHAAASRISVVRLCKYHCITVPIYHFQVITWMVPCEWLWKWSPHTSCCSPCAPCWSWALFTTPPGSYISMCGARSLVSATWHDSNIHSSITIAPTSSLLKVVLTWCYYIGVYYWTCCPIHVFVCHMCLYALKLSCLFWTIFCMCGDSKSFLLLPHASD